MSSTTHSIRIVAISTVLSRITGLLRDMLVYAVFGTSALNSAFIIAFTIPNLFRRFMGEGALTSALVPVLAHTQAQEGQVSAYRLFNRVFTRAAIALVVIILLGTGLFQLVHLFPSLPQRWVLSAQLGIWVFPYLFFICLSALIGAVLNLQRRFASTALAQIWVNLAMTLALGGVGLWVSTDPMVRMYWLCAGVILGGVLQLVLPGYALTRQGWTPKADLSADKKLDEVWTLLGPGLIGATVAQINTVVSQFLAFGLDDAAVSVLFLANRLMQLPLGVFAIAVTTVTFPIIARYAAQGDTVGFASSYRQGATLIQAVMIPAGVGLALLSGPILVVLFQWGSFDSASVAATAPILITYALAIPLYASTTLTTRTLHSLRDTHSPLRWGVITLIVNLGLSLILRDLMGTLGLALANTLSTLVLALGLRYQLQLQAPQLSSHSTHLVRLCLCAVVMAAAVLPIVWLAPAHKAGQTIAIIAGAGVGLAVYLLCLRICARDIFAQLRSLVWR